MSARLLQLATGGVVGMTTLGDPAAQHTVLLCHPTPGASGFDPDPVITGQRSVRIVSADRPGYGASSPRISPLAEPHLAELAVLDELTGAGARIDAVIGWGYGGLIALRVAAERPDAIARVALVQTAAPKNRLHDIVIRRTRAWIPQHRDPLRARAALLGGTRIKALSLLGAGDEDEALRLSGTEQRCERMLDQAVAQGEAGIEFDRRALHRGGWAPAARSLRARTLVLYGARDKRLGPSDAKWFARRLPHPHVEVIAETAAMTIASDWARVLDFATGDTVTSPTAADAAHE
ncbi:alpha/beta fold hydrolase [Gryllotalpicola reticulitermitis]|uniref:Alpha/beta fold hydrolase n=1 Tax=Gryllotalpicola reticulitermitis TaxID=1184153 RepID=A0ABV8Q9V1_9MICO